MVWREVHAKLAADSDGLTPWAIAVAGLNPVEFLHLWLEIASNVAEDGAFNIACEVQQSKPIAQTAEVVCNAQRGRGQQHEDQRGK